MYQLVIMDDAAQAAEAVRAAVEESPAAADFAITLVHSEAELSSLMETGLVPDVFLVDIKLEEGASDGIDLVRRLFPEGCGTQVIYVTGYIEYCTSVYETGHVYFLTKPVQQIEMNRALARAVRNLEARRHAALTVRFGAQVSSVPFSDITYLESKRRKIEVHTELGSQETYATISEVLEQLPERFFQCHKSFVVNFDYVTKIDGDGLVLRTGERVPVSQRRRQETRDRFFRYLGKA